LLQFKNGVRNGKSDSFQRRKLSKNIKRQMNFENIGKFSEIWQKFQKCGKDFQNMVEYAKIWHNFRKYGKNFKKWKKFQECGKNGEIFTTHIEKY